MVYFVNEGKTGLERKQEKIPSLRCLSNFISIFLYDNFYNKDMRKNYFENIKNIINVINGSNISITGNSKLTQCI